MGAALFGRHIAVLFAFSMSLKIQYLNNTSRAGLGNPKGISGSPVFIEETLKCPDLSSFPPEGFR